jgi:hypothetical protein
VAPPVADLSAVTGAALVMSPANTPPSESASGLRGKTAAAEDVAPALAAAPAIENDEGAGGDSGGSCTCSPDSTPPPPLRTSVLPAVAPLVLGSVSVAPWWICSPASMPPLLAGCAGGRAETGATSSSCPSAPASSGLPCTCNPARTLPPGALATPTRNPVFRFFTTAGCTTTSAGGATAEGGVLDTVAAGSDADGRRPPDSAGAGAARNEKPEPGAAPPSSDTGGASAGAVRNEKDVGAAAPLAGCRKLKPVVPPPPASMRLQQSRRELKAGAEVGKEKII